MLPKNKPIEEKKKQNWRMPNCPWRGWPVEITPVFSSLLMMVNNTNYNPCKLVVLSYFIWPYVLCAPRRLWWPGWSTCCRRARSTAPSTRTTSSQPRPDPVGCSSYIMWCDVLTMVYISVKVAEGCTGYTTNRKIRPFLYPFSGWDTGFICIRQLVIINRPLEHTIGQQFIVCIAEK